MMTSFSSLNAVESIATAGQSLLVDDDVPDTFSDNAEGVIEAQFLLEGLDVDAFEDDQVTEDLKAVFAEITGEDPENIVILGVCNLADESCSVQVSGKSIVMGSAMYL